MRAVSTETKHRSANLHFSTTTAGIQGPYSAQTFKKPTRCLSTTLILRNPGQRRLDFNITFRTDLFIKAYQRILSADYTVLSILPSVNLLNAWDGFSVIGGNDYVYGVVWRFEARTCQSATPFIRCNTLEISTIRQMHYTRCCVPVLSVRSLSVRLGSHTLWQVLA